VKKANLIYPNRRGFFLIFKNRLKAAFSKLMKKHYTRRLKSIVFLLNFNFWYNHPVFNVFVVEIYNVNKLFYIATGFLIAGYWLFSKFSVADNLEIKPLKFTVDPGLYQTNAAIQVLLQNKTNGSLKIDRIAGKLTDSSGKVYGTFKNNYAIRLTPRQTIIAAFTIETLTTDLIDITQTNYKNLILQGTSNVEGIYIPFKISLANVWA
jgi:hypothetical protein